MKTLTVLSGLPAALVVGFIVLFTMGEVQAIAVLAAWIVLTFTAAAVMPRPVLPLVVLIQRRPCRSS